MITPSDTRVISLRFEKPSAYYPPEFTAFYMKECEQRIANKAMHFIRTTITKSGDVYMQLMVVMPGCKEQESFDEVGDKIKRLEVMVAEKSRQIAILEDLLNLKMGGS